MGRCFAAVPFRLRACYTTFKLENLRLEKKTITRGRLDARVRGRDEHRASASEPRWRNSTSGICVSSVTRPVKELKGFEKVRLQPGESKTVTFDITPNSLAFYGLNMKYVVEPGEFEIMVGNSSRDEDLQRTILIVKK